MEELTQDGAQLARTMLMSAAQLAESMARVQAQRAWMAQSRSAAQAAQAQQQIAAERDAARMIFRPLTDDRYWHDSPQLDRVVQGYMTAASWAEHDPEARAGVQVIKQHAEERWGREVGAGHHVSDSARADHDQEVGDTSMTAKQRKLLVDLGLEPADGLTKVEASQAIHERLTVSAADDIRGERNASHRQRAEVAETVLAGGIAKQADVRIDHLGDQVTASGGTAADAEARAARRQSHPAAAQPIQQWLSAARRLGQPQGVAAPDAPLASRGRKSKHGYQSDRFTSAQQRG